MLERAGTGARTNSAGDTVLVVEDDPGVATLERRRLERAGYTVVCAATAEEALEEIERGDVKLIVLDQGLPDAAGLDFYERLKEGGHDLPVIMVTGLSDEATVIEALRAGVRDFVTKSPEYLDYLPEAAERVLAQVHTEQRLEESEERFRGLVENLQVGVILTDPRPRILLGNQAALDLLGLPEEQVLGKTLLDFDWNAVREDGSPFPAEEYPVLRAITTGQPVRNVVMGLDRAPLDDRVWLLVNVEPQLDARGSVQQVISTFSDITERKWMEEALRDSEAFAHSTLNSLSAHIAIVDESGTILAVNKAWREFAELNGGIVQGVTEGANYLQVCDSATGAWSEEAVAFAKGIRSVLSGQREEFTLEYPCHSPDEQRRFIGRVTSFPAGGLRRAVVAHENITELSQAEQALRESEERYRTFVRRSSEGIWRFELDRPLSKDSPEDEQVEHFYRHAYLAECNDAMAKMYGYSQAEEIMGAKLGDLLPPSVPENLEYLRSFVRSGYRLSHAESREVDRQGDTRDFLNNLVGIVEDDLVVRAWGTQTDVTERKRAEERVHFQAHLLDAVGQAVIATDLHGRVIYWNQAAEKLYGWSEEEVLGRLGRDFMLSEDQLEQADEIMSELRAGRNWSGEFLVRRRDGTSFPALVTDTLVHDEQGNPVGIIGVSTDITERKRAEEALRESEARHFAVVNSAFDAIVTMTSDGNIEAFNEEAENVFGYRTEEVVGQPVALLMPERFREKHQAGLSSYLRGGTSRLIGQRRIELVGQRKDGEEFPLELSLAEVRGRGNPLFTAIIRDITERKRAEERLRYQAFHDSLTNLPNRQLFVDRLEQALARTERSEGKVAVLFMDLDNFKVVNDSLGHEAGDRLLVVVGERLQNCLRPEDTIARFGGDEFAVLLETAETLSVVVRVAKRICKELQEPFVLDGRKVSVSVSIGIALGDYQRDLPEELLRNADVAMFRAKSKGNVNYQVFDQSMHDQALRRLELENDLRRSIEREEFTLHYQPKVSVETGRVCGFEALLRWNHPQRGLIPPAEFIPLAEETGLIVPIGRWVLEESCRRAKEWQVRYPVNGTPLKVSVNLSPRQFNQPGLVESVAQVLRETGLDPCDLGLEVTESVTFQNPRFVRTTLQKLKALGVQVEIDDFGTGYSSLSRLKDLPIDVLKIDRSFVAGLREDAEDEHIISSILSLASGLGLGVVAEGVETSEQATQLRALGCRTAQGYYFSKPLPEEAVEELLASHAQQQTTCDFTLPRQ